MRRERSYLWDERAGQRDGRGAANAEQAHPDQIRSVGLREIYGDHRLVVTRLICSEVVRRLHRTHCERKGVSALQQHQDLTINSP